MGGRFASIIRDPLEANGVPPTYDSLHKCRKAKTPLPGRGSLRAVRLILAQIRARGKMGRARRSSLPEKRTLAKMLRAFSRSWWWKFLSGNELVRSSN